MSKRKTRLQLARNKSLKIAAQSRYALRILKDLADHCDDELLTTEAAIAERQQISLKFLSRIVLPLRDAGFVKAHRGKRTGFRLLKRPEEISLLAVIEAVQGPVNILDCLNEKTPCRRKAECYARAKWKEANEAIRNALDAIRLDPAPTAAEPTAPTGSE